MNIVGEKVLSEAVNALGLQIKGPATASIEVIAKLRKVDFARDGETFAQACVTIAAQPEGEAALRRAMDDRLKLITAMALSDQDKLLMLAIALLSEFRDGVVNAALSFVGKAAVQTATPQTSPAPQ